MFQKLKRVFTNAPIYNHFDLAKPIILQTNACCIVIASIYNQYDSFMI